MSGFSNYDRWKLMSPEDEEDERRRIYLRNERLRDKAEHDRERAKDERSERESNRRLHSPADE